MKLLLDIRTKPIELDMKYEKAKLEYIRQAGPSYVMTRVAGELDISYKPGRVVMDSYDMKASLGFKNNTDFTKENAAKASQAVQEYMQRAGEEANIMLNAGSNNSSPDFMAKIASARMANEKSFGIAFLPSSPIKMDYQPYELNMHYTKDQLNFNWNVHTKTQFKYTPASLDFTVTQYPSVEVTYLGDPLYVPPSAAPIYA